MTRYIEITDELMRILGENNALKAFRAAMMARAERVSRDQVACIDDVVLHTLRGQLTICFELADRASLALAEKDAKAKAPDADGIPEWPIAD